MKTILKIQIIVALLFASLSTHAQSPKMAEVKIYTSAVCGMCKEKLEKDMAFEKGVKKSELDLKTKVLTVWYNPKKTTPEKIRLAVSKIGYDADSIPADSKAYSKLDDCCKKGAVCNDK